MAIRDKDTKLAFGSKNQLCAGTVRAMSKTEQDRDSCCIVYVGTNFFRVLLADDSEAEVSVVWSGDEDLSSQLEVALGSLSPAVRAICFLLSSDQCYPCTVHRAVSDRSITSDFLKYAAEELLPIAAEDVSIIHHELRQSSFVICTSRTLVETLAKSTRLPCRVLPLTLLLVELLNERNATTEPTLFEVSIESLPAVSVKPAGTEHASGTSVSVTEIMQWDRGPTEWRSGVCRADEGSADLILGHRVGRCHHATFSAAELRHTLTSGAGSFVLNPTPFDFLHDTEGAKGASKRDEFVQRLCQIVLFSSLIVVVVFSQRSAEMHERFIEVTEARSALFDDVAPEVKGAPTIRKLQSELQRRKELAEQVEVWREGCQGADEAIAGTLERLLSVKNVSLNSISAMGKSVQINIRTAQDSESTDETIRSLFHGDEFEGLQIRTDSVAADIRASSVTFQWQEQTP